MRIEPGEPVPPGFENEVKQVAELKKTIDKHRIYTLIGLEYVVELVLGKGFGHSYFCCLCKEHSSSAAMVMIHIKSYQHRLKYLLKHYPTTTATIMQYLNRPNSEKVLSGQVEKLCAAIEDNYGRLTPTVYDCNEFNKNRRFYIDKIGASRHFVERPAYMFDNYFDLKLIESSFKSK